MIQQHLPFGFPRPPGFEPLPYGNTQPTNTRRCQRTFAAQGIVENTLPEGVQSFDQCRVPLAVSAFDVSRLTTRVVEEGNIAPALRATCTFPGLFAPVWHEQGVLVDGGIRDTTGASLIRGGVHNLYF